MKSKPFILMMLGVWFNTNTQALPYESTEQSLSTPPSPPLSVSDEHFNDLSPSLRGLNFTHNGWRFAQASPNINSQMGSIAATNTFIITPEPSDMGWLFNIDSSGLIDGPNNGAFDYRISTVDFSEFKLDSLEADMGAFNPDNGYQFQTTVIGIRNETIVVSEVVDFTIGDNEGSVEYIKNPTPLSNGGVLKFNSQWQNIDEIRFTGGSASTISRLMIDDIGISAPVENTAPPVLSLTSVSHPLCHGNSTGSAIVSVTGGVGNYTYLASTGFMANTPATSILLSNLSAGDHQVIVTDNNGLKDTVDFTINQPMAINVSSHIISNVGCNGEATGSILPSVYGGTPPYTYVWSTGATTAFVNNLSSGTYTVTVSDANGCSTETSVTLNQPMPSSSTQFVSATDSYQWIDGVIYTESTNTPTFTLTNAEGCDSVVTLNLTLTASQVNYCSSRSTRNRFEWIKEVNINTHINETAADGSGYGNYTDQIIEVDTGDVVTVELTPGYRRRVYDEYWRIWADWNYDGDFDDAGEKVFEQKGKNIQTGSFTVPVHVEPDHLQLRVSMRWRKYAPACGSFRNGEVEDYTIKVNGGQGYLSSGKYDRLSYQDPSDGEELYEFVDIYPTRVTQGDFIHGYLRVNTPGTKQFYILNTLGQIVLTFTQECNEEENRIELPTTGLSKGMYFIKGDSDVTTVKMVVE